MDDFNDLTAKWSLSLIHTCEFLTSSCCYPEQIQLLSLEGTSSSTSYVQYKIATNMVVVWNSNLYPNLAGIMP